jgi:alginate O-acetyltransferase complex protein AlgI
MLYNSYLFIFLFLPVTLTGYYLTSKSKHPRFAIAWLIALSLLFYGWYNPLYVILISCSVLFNYFTSMTLAKGKTDNHRKWLLAFGITINILLLGYFKYTNFFIDSTNTLFHTNFQFITTLLPLGISFFTLQQIAYLVDTYRHETGKHGLLDYCLFITFFPKLISGPIVRFKEWMPNFVKEHIPQITMENLAVALALFFLGLFKKVILGDTLGVYATPVFDLAFEGVELSFFNAWSGALAYTFQLYFDFSGYCDMAIALGLMFGMRLPLNFYSPYKATGIIDFWRRWHITLSQFLRDYMYIPLGGNRRGFPRQAIYLMIVMVIAGFWHGAGLTFIIWGALHGIYLVINHSWRLFRRRMSKSPEKNTRLGTLISILITFIATTVAWVFFRAESLGAAAGILKGMTGINGFILPTSYHEAFGILGQFLGRIGTTFAEIPVFSHMAVIWIVISLIICWFLPNAVEYMSKYTPALNSFGQRDEITNRWLRWKPNLWGALVIAVITVIAILGLTQTSTFLYFRF